MDMNGNLRTYHLNQPSFNFVYSNDYDQQFQGMEAMKNSTITSHGNGNDLVFENGGIGNNNNNYNNQDKKKRLSYDQLESLERSFQEEKKLEPDRKMKLSRELGMQPRQIAVWFQNRRARWKTKQLEQLYDALKHQFHIVSIEKQKLQEEVMELKAIIGEETRKKQGSTACCYTEISGEETVESTSDRMKKSVMIGGGNPAHQLFNVDEYNLVNLPYWIASDGGLTCYPLSCSREN